MREISPIHLLRVGYISHYHGNYYVVIGVSGLENVNMVM